MANWRTIVISALLLVTVSGLTASLSGCGNSGQADGGTNAEVKLEPPRDASGKEFRVEDEYKSEDPAK